MLKLCEVDEMETLTFEQINQWHDAYIHDPLQTAMRHAVYGSLTHEKTMNNHYIL